MEFELWVRIVKESIQKGNINPWDINVAKVADEYIKTLKELERFDIRLSADVILVGGILLRMKSQVLYERCASTYEENDEGSFPEDDENHDYVYKGSKGEKINTIKSRKKITTEELIDTLKLELKKVKKSKGKKRDKKEEVLYEVIEEMEKYDISELMESLILELREEGIIVFQERFPDKKDRVKNFLPYLYLANEGKVEIFQEEVFREIVIKYREENIDKTAILNKK